MNNQVVILIVIILSLCSYGNTENILGLYGCPSPSHHLWNEVIVNTLADRGHHLTVVSVNKNDKPHQNVTYIHLEQTYQEFYEKYNDSGPNFGSSPGILHNVGLMNNFKLVSCKGMFASKGFQDALDLKKKFDLILYDSESGPCLFRFIQKYPNIPVVMINPYKMEPELIEIAGGHSYPAYIPHILTKQDTPMNLWHRLYNSITYSTALLLRKYVVEPHSEALWKEHFPDSIPSLNELYKQVKIVLSNTHPSIDRAQSIPPNLIEVGGLHIKEPKPLPDEIRKFIESSKSGAILMSLGTNIKIEKLHKQQLKAILEVIKKFSKYNFLWKVEKDNIIESVPRNLLLKTWVPQNDVLAHPKIKAFFTHAGGLSMQEAVWHGVPVIAMPFFLDQFNNAYRAHVEKYGQEINFDELNEETLMKTFLKVLNDKTITENIRIMQKNFRDRQNKPLDTAIWWIEYCLRNPHVDHLIPYSRNMSFFVANSFDIVAICLLMLLIFLIFISLTVIYCCKKSFNNKENIKLKEKRNKKTK